MKRRGLKQQDLTHWIKQTRREASVIAINPRGPILVEHEETVTIKAHFTNNSDGQFVATWQKVEHGVARNLSLVASNYNGSSCDLANLKLVINNTDRSDTGDYQLEIRSLTETITSQQVTVKVYNGSLSYISNEETNFFRLYLLCHQIGTRAVRLLFDRYVTPTNLHSHLQKHRKDLEEGNRRLNLQRCTLDQLMTLFRVKPGVGISSDDFDLTLLYKVIRCTVTQISSHASRWNHAPLPQHIGESDDLEIIHQCRNSIAHDTKLRKTDAEFEVMWNEIYGAIDRLSNGSLKKEMADLKNMIFPTDETKQILDSIEEVKECFKNQCDVIKQIESRITIIEEDKHIPKHVRESQQQILTSWRDEDRIFYSNTSVCKAGWEMVKAEKITTFIGSPGSGKTATSRHIALRLEREEGYEIVPVCKPEQIEGFVNIKQKQVFVLDDVLGKLCLDMSLYNSIECLKKGLLKGIGKDSKIVVTSRKTVFKEAEKLNTYITDNFIDFQARKKLFSENDKRQILQNHCKENNISEKDFQEMSLKSADIMFPLLCKLFSTDIKYRKLGETFFNQPIKCLVKEIDKLEYASKSYYPALILCLVNDGEISWDNLPSQEIKTDIYNHCGINLGTSDGEIMNAMEKMTDTYLRGMNKVYTFIHDSIEEVVAFHYGSKFPDQILKYMPSSYISNRVNVCPQTSPVDDFYITLSASHFPQFAERLFKDIESLELYDVFMNPALKHRPFLDEFLKLLNSKPFNTIHNLFCLKQENKDDSIYVFQNSQFFYKEDNVIWNEYERQQILLNATNDSPSDIFYDIESPFYISKRDVFSRVSIRIISWVVYYGHENILKNIVNTAMKNKLSIADVIGKDMLEQSRLLTLACFSNSYSMVDFLLKYVKLDCINSCLTENHEEIIPDNYHKFCFPTSAACQTGNFEIVKLLLKHGAEFCLNVREYIPLACAITEGHFKVFKHIANEQKESMSCEMKDLLLLYAVGYGHNDIFHLLVQFGADINVCTSSNEYPLILACRIGHAQIVQYLMRLGADQNCCDKEGRSPLIVASKSGHTEIVKILIEKGPAVNHCDVIGNSALMEASQHGHLGIVQLLIENGGNINLKNSLGESALMLSRDKYHIVKFLLENHACVNEENSFSLILNAVQDKNFAVCELLFRYGAKISKGLSRLLSYATMLGRYDLVDLLLTNCDQREHISLVEPLKVSQQCLLCNGMYHLINVIHIHCNKGEGHWLKEPLKIAFWEGHTNILQRLVTELNQKGMFLGNHCLFDLLTDLTKSKLPCYCYEGSNLSWDSFFYDLKKYKSIISFIADCSEKTFSRLLKIGLNPNSSYGEHGYKKCLRTGIYLIDIILSEEVNVWYRKEKIALLLANKVNINIQCEIPGDRIFRTYRSRWSNEDSKYISLIEYARLQSNVKYESYEYYAQFCFEMDINYDDVLSEIVKYSRRKSV